MKEHTGFHNKEQFSPDCPRCVSEQKGLEEHEIKHIEMALKDHYKDEWCSVCDNIARKLGFSPLE